MISSDLSLYNSLLFKNSTRRRKRLHITWLGTAGVRISDGDTSILIDPYVSRFRISRIIFNTPLEPDIPLVRKWTEVPDKSKTRAVLVSHTHFDHAADAPHFARFSGAPLVGSDSAVNIGRGARLPETMLIPVAGGQVRKFGKFKIQFLESRHGPVFFNRVPYPGNISGPPATPMKARRYRVGTVFSFILTHPYGTIIHHGSAGFIPGMYDGIGADLLLLGIAGRGDTGEYLDAVAAAVKPRLLVPIHLDNFFRSLERGVSLLPGIRFREFCRAAALKVPASRLATLPLCSQVDIPF